MCGEGVEGGRGGVSKEDEPGPAVAKANHPQLTLILGLGDNSNFHQAGYLCAHTSTRDTMYTQYPRIFESLDREKCEER